MGLANFLSAEQSMVAMKCSVNLMMCNIVSIHGYVSRLLLWYIEFHQLILDGTSFYYKY